MNKRLLKEINNLYKQQQFYDSDNNFIISYENESLSAIIRAPQDSVYRHKFIRLDFEIPSDYPHSPPKVYFKNYDAVRIHPNMYEDGKCCATILNTWGDNIYEKWTSSMGIENILVMFHSFLDNNPYTYEPGGKDDPSYTVYVQHQSWYTCLIKYLMNERNTEFKRYMYTYILKNIDKIYTDLAELEQRFPSGEYYTRCFGIGNYNVDYKSIIGKLQVCYGYLDYNFEEGIELYELLHNVDGYTCNICYDTFEDPDMITLSCGHTFHKECCSLHVKNNNKLCSMCRKDIPDENLQLLVNLNVDADPGDDQPQFMINPQTNRRIKIGGKVWKNLVNTGVI